MGGCIDVPGPVRVKVDLSSARTIRRACLMRDGELLPWQEVGARVAALELVDEAAAPCVHWYSVTVEGSERYPKGPLFAHTSPFCVNV